MPPTRTAFEGVPAEVIDVPLLAEALERLESVAVIGEVELVIAADLAASARRRLSPEEALIFDPRRVTGFVGAKTIFRGDGCSLVIDARLLVPGVAAAAAIDVPRTFEHEGWHLVLRSRDEDQRAASSRLRPAGARAHFIGQAVVIIDEYRVEKALLERGFPLPQSYENSSGEALDEFAEELLDAITLRFPNESMRRCYETVVRGFNAITTNFGYLAVGDGDLEPLRSLTAWPRYVGVYFDRMRAVLRGAPSAATPMSSELLDSITQDVADVLRDWLRHIGFDLRDLPDGELYMDVLRQDF